ncbi:MAG: diacylglycerol kinase family protein [Saprospiraceae bacterium]|nr:diacylglycerol kinase family protein [Saprospiraceae bacterium]
MRNWLNSVGHAIQGIGFLIKTERNFRIEIAFAGIAIFLGIWLHISMIEFCIVLLCIGAVLSAEAFNSAVERMADFQSLEIHPDIKSIKDIAAGGVLLVAFITFVIGLMIFAPRLMELLAKT